jgi:hypothetical protein
MTKSSDGVEVGLPPVVFFFTLDQIAMMLNVDERTVRTSYLYYAARTTGPRYPRLMYTINIAANPVRDAPEWRVSHQEFVRWLRNRGYRISTLQHPR